MRQLKGLSAEAAEAQDFVCGLAERIRKLADRQEVRKSKEPPVDVSFSWLFNRSVSI